MKKVVDTQNTLAQHLIVGTSSIALALAFKYLMDLSWSVSFARVSFILLFLTLLVSPLMRIKKPSKASNPLKSPWFWRGELGIWFVVTGVIHFFFAMSGHIAWDLSVAFGPGGYGLANLMGVVALAWGIMLACTSCRKAICSIGIKSWKWLHSFTYVVFYLISFHVVYFQFLSEYRLKNLGMPDWFGYAAIAMVILLVVLQFIAFIKAVVEK